MKYLVAVKIGDNTEIFEFDNHIDRQIFIVAVAEFDVECATTEVD